MFYYYGRKKQIAKHYPDPEFDLIVEPFAGAASYALYKNNWRREVVLIELDRRVCDVWMWLRDEATPETLLRMPNLEPGEKSSEFLHIIHAATKMAFAYKTIKVTPVLARNWEISKRKMAESLHKIRHWEIIRGDYTAAPDREATWFIDPPYKDDPGRGYAHGSDSLDYDRLATWVESRKGQTIACEGEYGDYLPFAPLLNLPGVAGKRSREVMYHRSGGKQSQLSLL